MKPTEYQKALVGGNSRLILMAHTTRKDADGDALHTAVTADGVSMAVKAGFVEAKVAVLEPVEAKPVEAKPVEAKVAVLEPKSGK